MKCYPRPPPVRLDGRDALKTPWDFYKSVFKTYKADNKKSMDECFEIDWPMTKLDKFIKNGYEETKDYIKSIYHYIREMYKYYSGLNPLGRLMAFSMLTLHELLHNCNGFVDGTVIKATDIDLAFIACNGGKKITNHLSPEKGLVRYQMAEMLIRLAVDKFLKSGETKSYLEAVKRAFEEHYLVYFKTFASIHKFRKERLWREEMDVLLTRLEAPLQEVFRRNTGKYLGPG